MFKSILFVVLIVGPVVGGVTLAMYTTPKITHYDYVLEVTCGDKTETIKNVDYFCGNGGWGFGGATANHIYLLNGLRITVPISCQIKEIERVEEVDNAP